MLWSLVCKMRLELSTVLLIGLDEWLVLGCDIVVVQEWPLIQPIRQMWNCTLHHFESAILIDVLAIRR